MSAVRAKFKVDAVIHRSHGGCEVALSPVTGGSPENDAFYKWTPAGKIDLATVNATVASILLPGCEVYVDFTPAE